MSFFSAPKLPDADLQILQEELESKIAENEHLVISTSELLRDKRELENLCSSVQTEKEKLQAKVAALAEQLELAQKSTHSLQNEKAKNEIVIDALKREIELCNQKNCVLLETETLLAKSETTITDLKSQIDHFQSHVIRLEAQCEQTNAQMLKFQSHSELLERSLVAEKSEAQARQFRIDQLVEQIAILQAATSRNSGEKNAAQFPPCNPGIPCCYRAEYYQTRSSNFEAVLRQN